jgi:hypothetical protein
MSEAIEVPVHFRHRGEIYQGTARFRDNWHHIGLTGRLIKTGGWDYALACKEIGDDKFAITADQLEELRQGRHFQTDLPGGEPVTIEPGDYPPFRDDRSQGQLFDT